MIFGAHVSAAGGLLKALERAEDIGAEIAQVHTQSPRIWKPYSYTPELLEEFASRSRASPRLKVTVCHASYLINVASRDRELLSKSRTALVGNLTVATRMGAASLILHPGSHLGSGFESVLKQLASELTRALDTATAELGDRTCALLLENTAGAGGTVGRSFEELGRIIDTASGDDRLGVCLDTQHLFASGVNFGTLDEADSVVATLARDIGLERLGCIHLNDSKVPFGSNRDRHENLGAGFIGRTWLGSLVAHPALQSVPAVLEVPGPENRGPAAADLRTARTIHAAGRRRWARRCGTPEPATPPPRRGPPPGQGARRGSPRGR